MKRMNPNNGFIYEHPLICPKLQKRIYDGKNIFININNQLHWIFENKYSKQLIVSNMETDENVIEISIKSSLKYDFSKLNVILYDDFTLWIGRNFVESFDNYQQICGDDKYYKAIPNHKNEVFIVDLLNSTFEHIITDYDITYFKAISGMYFTTKINNQTLVFDWNDLLNVNKELIPLHTFHSNVNLFPVNWRESSICKACIGSQELQFLDKNFHELFSLNTHDLCKKYKPIEDIDVHDSVISIITINDNCLLYLECREMIDGKHDIIKQGFKCVYCFDFTNETEISFVNEEIDCFIHDIIPYRFNNKIYYITHEWYPGGSWCNKYDSL